jgi:NaMN:DMB phosphoribosyltransferase
MYRKILVAVDNTKADDSLLPHISRLAKMLDSKILLVHVADGWAADDELVARLDEVDLGLDDTGLLDRLAAAAPRRSALATTPGWHRQLVVGVAQQFEASALSDSTTFFSPGRRKARPATQPVAPTEIASTIASSTLAKGGINNEILSITLPDNLTPGIYFIGAVADSGNQITESDETNNASNASAILLGNSADNAT